MLSIGCAEQDGFGSSGAIRHRPTGAHRADRDLRPFDQHIAVRMLVR
jgi:hypothetical protein